MYRILLSQGTVLTLKALAALSHTEKKTHPHAEMHFGCLGLSDKQQHIQLQYSLFSQELSKRFFILRTEVLKYENVTMSGVAFDWRNNNKAHCLSSAGNYHTKFGSSPHKSVSSSPPSAIVHAEPQL